MSRVPETRASLILRLPSANDADAWGEFTSIYEPFVYRFARRGGLQDADAKELVQDVLLSVARAVGRWKPDGDRARFRTWLFRIAKNRLLDVLAKHKLQMRTQGDESFFGGIDELSMTTAEAERQVELEHHRELFRWAATRVEKTVKRATWQAFWQTAVQHRSVEEVAEEMQMTTGAVYIARSRVLSRLRDEIRKWEDDDEMS